jgi:hypothetical protein
MTNPFLTEVDRERETAAAASAAIPTHLLSPAKRANLGNRAVAGSRVSVAAPFEVAVLAEEQCGQPPGDHPSGELRRTLDRLAHELNEALCALTNYLAGSRILLATNDPVPRHELDTAIANALEQASRARLAVHQQRSALR